MNDIYTPQQTCDTHILELSPIWNSLTPDQKEYISRDFKAITVPKNGEVYSEGEQPQALLCIAAGKVKIFKEGIGGRSQIVRIVEQGGFFGYRAMFAKEKYVTTATAIEDTIIYAVPEEVILNLIKSNAELAFSFIKLLSKDLGLSDSRSVSLTQKHIKGRLAETLLHLKENYGVENDGRTLSVDLPRKDLANMSNMTTANAIRTLSQFASEGLIEVNRRRIKILDEIQLTRIAKFE